MLSKAQPLLFRTGSFRQPVQPRFLRQLADVTPPAPIAEDSPPSQQSPEAVNKPSPEPPRHTGDNDALLTIAGAMLLGLL
jgi:hypothetical protein